MIVAYGITDMLQVFQGFGISLGGAGYQITLLEGIACKSMKKKVSGCFCTGDRKVEIMQSSVYLVLCNKLPWNLVSQNHHFISLSVVGQKHRKDCAGQFVSDPCGISCIFMTTDPLPT